MDKKENLGISVAVINEKLDVMQKDVSEIKETIRKDYVTKEEFTPIKNLVYGFVSVVLAAFIGMMIYLVGWVK